VVKGTTGGNHPVYAYVLVNPENLTKMLPEHNAVALDPKEEKAFNALGYKSSYRGQAFEREGLGVYSPENPLVKSLAEKGLIKISPSGITFTLAGKNHRAQSSRFGTLGNGMTDLEKAWGKVAGPGSENPFIRQQLVSAASDLLDHLRDAMSEFEHLRPQFVKEAAEIEKQAVAKRKDPEGGPQFTGSNESQRMTDAVNALRDFADQSAREQYKTLRQTVGQMASYVRNLKAGRYT
jgi:hypothetical protein